MYDRTDLSPWDRVPRPRQEASDTPTRMAGVTSVDRSPWYVGHRYIANALLAERERERQRVRDREAADRRAAYLARQRGED